MELEQGAGEAMSSLSLGVELFEEFQSANVDGDGRVGLFKLFMKLE